MGEKSVFIPGSKSGKRGQNEQKCSSSTGEKSSRKSDIQGKEKWEHSPQKKSRAHHSHDLSWQRGKHTKSRTAD